MKETSEYSSTSEDDGDQELAVQQKAAEEDNKPAGKVGILQPTGVCWSSP